MFSPIKKILVWHVASLTLVSVISVHLVLEGVNGPGSEIFLPGLRLFFGVFFVGALVLGMGGALRPGLTIGGCLLRGDDLNDAQIRDQLQGFMVFFSEIYVAVLVLLLIGFVRVGE